MFTAVVGLTVLMGAGGMPSDPERLSGAEPGVDPDPPSELEEGPISVTTCPARPLSTDLQRRGHLRSRSIQPLPADALMLSRSSISGDAPWRHCLWIY